MTTSPYAPIHPVDVFAAAKRIRGIVNRTPLRKSDKLSALAGLDVYLKLENEQKTGSFKLRGAYNALALLTRQERERGVVAASAGNHGQGVALAARELGIHATIFVPASAPKVKKDGIRSFGATIDESQPHYDAAHAAAVEHAERVGATYVDPCSGGTLLAGQGTVGLEILEDLPDVGTIVVPLGGAGLASGVADFIRSTAPHVRIVGVQSEHTNALALSLDAGHIVGIPDEPTLADGLAGQADEGALELTRRSVDEITVVTEDELGFAMAWLSREEGVKAEGAGSVAVAAMLRRQPHRFRPPVVLIVSGGNVDGERLTRLLERYRPTS